MNKKVKKKLKWRNLANRWHCTHLLETRCRRHFEHTEYFRYVTFIWLRESSMDMRCDQCTCMRAYTWAIICGEFEFCQFLSISTHITLNLSFDCNHIQLFERILSRIFECFLIYIKVVTKLHSFEFVFVAIKIIEWMIVRSQRHLLKVNIETWTNTFFDWSLQNWIFIEENFIQN